MERGPLSRQERGRLWTRLGIRGILCAGGVILSMLAAPPLLSLAAPFLPALGVAWLLNRPVRWLQCRWGISRRAVSLILLLVILGALVLVLYGLIRLGLGQLRALAENWPALMEEVRSAAEAAMQRLEAFLPPGLRGGWEGLMERLARWMEKVDPMAGLTALAGRTPSLVSGVSGFGLAVVVFVMASYFITGDYPRLRMLLADGLPEETRQFCAAVRSLFFAAFGGYLKSQILLSLGVFAILAAGFFAVGQPYSLLLAAGLAVLDFIPIVGAGTVMVPWALLCWLGGRWQRAVGLLVIWGVIALFRRGAEPRVLGSRTGLSPILSLVGIYVGMKLAGVAGMILGPVLLMVVVDLGRLGVFRPAAADLRAALRDIRALLDTGKDSRSE